MKKDKVTKGKKLEPQQSKVEKPGIDDVFVVTPHKLGKKKGLKQKVR